MKSKKISRNSGNRTHVCEGCGREIPYDEEHYSVSFGTSGDVLLPLGQVLFYHKNCLDPYMITIWLQEGQAVAITNHTD